MRASLLRTATFCILALIGFAANSLLTRLALRPHLIDAAGFTIIRLTAGALVLAMLARLRRPVASAQRGTWTSGLLLFAYAAPFSFAYLRLGAGIGALVLFGSVQVTMIGRGILKGESPSIGEWVGLILAFGGLAALTLPGASRPEPLAFFFMVAAGAAWGAYSLAGRASSDPLGATAGNFLYSVPAAMLLAGASQLIPALGPPHATPTGVALAVSSGAVASGVAYTLWYAALPGLTALRAALVQLSVPVIAALGAAALLDEQPNARLMTSGAIVLGGVALALLMGARRPRR